MSHKKTQSVYLKLQAGQVELIMKSLKQYGNTLKYMLGTEKCSDREREYKIGELDKTYEQILLILAEQVNSKAIDEEQLSDFTKNALKEEKLAEIIPFNKNINIG